MCGIIGCVTQSRTTSLPNFLESAITTLYHRGPDSNGKWIDRQNGIGLAHTRLSIQDVSAAGNQPMHSSCGRYVITFNGEIYNHRDLRTSLRSTKEKWCGSSDTETLLACITTWGLEETLSKIVGMFAFAIWDNLDKQLSIARDRLGEKPLYYGQIGGDFVFASEVHALKHHPAWDAVIDRAALSELLRTNYIPSPNSIFKNINQLEPGTYLTYNASTQNSTIQSYWSVKDVAERALKQNSYPTSDKECLNQLDQIFRTSVSDQMLSDVPLGAFLSGGVDSTAVVAMMQSLSSQPIKSFTIGFEEKNYNEADQAKEVAKLLGTDHTELYVSSNDVLDVIPKLSQLYTEPFADSSQVPTHLVSCLAEQSVKVALTGDGGDEIFGGYNRYLAMNSYWPKISKVPIGIRRLASSCLASLSSTTIDNFAIRVGSILGTKYRMGNASDKVRKIADILRVDTPDAFYNTLVSHWLTPELVVVGNERTPLAPKLLLPSNVANNVERMMLADQLTYLPNDILVKVDRAAMGTSLETRAPFLDHRLVEFAWGLPLHMKIRNGRGKWLLRELVYKHVPRKLVDRPKAGFALPIDLWLRGPLRDWAEDLLSEQRLSEGGYFHAKPIREKWEAHLSGKSNWQHHLWSVLMFQSWLESNK